MSTCPSEAIIQDKGDFMNLDKLLKKVELNKQTESEQKSYPLEVGGDTYEVKTFTRRQKRDFFYAMEVGQKQLTIGDMVKRSIPFIYKCLDLAPLAERAKQDKLIVRYYDIVEALFEPDEICQIIAFMTEINNISEKQTDEEVEDLKKQ